MFINATGFYVPEERVDNSYFYKIIKLVVLIMGGGEHSFAADTKKGPSNL